MLALGLDVLVYDPYLDKEYAEKNKIKTVDKIEELIRDIDILSLTLPLTDESEGMINSQLLSEARQNIVLINTYRALIIDQTSLIESLKTGKIRAFLTDVLEEEPMVENHPLLMFDNVLITPHIGSRTYETVQRQGLMAVENLLKELKID